MPDALLLATFLRWLLLKRTKSYWKPYRWAKAVCVLPLGYCRMCRWSGEYRDRHLKKFCLVLWNVCWHYWSSHVNRCVGGAVDNTHNAALLGRIGELTLGSECTKGSLKFESTIEPTIEPTKLSDTCRSFYHRRAPSGYIYASESSQQQRISVRFFGSWCSLRHQCQQYRANWVRWRRYQWKASDTTEMTKIKNNLHLKSYIHKKLN